MAAGLTVMTASLAAAQDEAAFKTLPEWDVVPVAHRGLAPGYPENTMAAFRNVIERGLTVIEVDLRGTADGEVVIMHDETVDRTTDGSGAVGELTYAEIATLDAGSYADPKFAGEKVPTYAEVLDLAKDEGIVLLLDIKESPTLDRERIVRLTEERNALLNVIGGVRSVEDLRTFRSLNPNIRLLGFIPEPEAIDAFAAAGIDIIRLWPRWINGEEIPASCEGRSGCLVERVHALGKPVWSTTNEAGREELFALMQLGVNGFLTDVPDEMSALMDDIEAFRAGN
ncbi:MAG: glycerophosphodiester phosphodiesterase family protein [Pseudomonadota bacterium]